MSDSDTWEYQTVSAIPAEPGWRAVYLAGNSTIRVQRVAAWLIQEQRPVRRQSGREIGRREAEEFDEYFDRRVVAGVIEEVSLYPVELDPPFWMVLDPGEPGPTTEEIAAEAARQAAYLLARNGAAA